MHPNAIRDHSPLVHWPKPFYRLDPNSPAILSDKQVLFHTVLKKATVPSDNNRDDKCVIRATNHNQSQGTSVVFAYRQYCALSIQLAVLYGQWPHFRLVSQKHPIQWVVIHFYPTYADND